MSRLGACGEKRGASETPLSRKAPTFSECFESLRRQIWIKDLACLGIGGARRQEWLTALGAELLRVQTPALELLDELLAANTARNEPPLLAAEVEQVVVAVLREEVHRLHEAGAPEGVTP